MSFDFGGIDNDDDDQFGSWGDDVLPEYPDSDYVDEESELGPTLKDNLLFIHRSDFFTRPLVVCYLDRSNLTSLAYIPNIAEHEWKFPYMNKSILVFINERTFVVHGNSIKDMDDVFSKHIIGQNAFYNTNKHIEDIEAHILPQLIDDVSRNLDVLSELSPIRCIKPTAALNREHGSKKPIIDIMSEHEIDYLLSPIIVTVVGASTYYGFVLYTKTGELNCTFSSVELFHFMENGGTCCIYKRPLKIEMNTFYPNIIDPYIIDNYIKGPYMMGLNSFSDGTSPKRFFTPFTKKDLDEIF